MAISQVATALMAFPFAWREAQEMTAEQAKDKRVEIYSAFVAAMSWTMKKEG